MTTATKRTQRPLELRDIDDLDGRDPLPRKFRTLCRRLRDSSPIPESVQKDVLVRRCAFLTIQVEAMEVAAMASGVSHPSTHAMAVNTLVALLRGLRLDRVATARAERDEDEDEDEV